MSYKTITPKDLIGALVNNGADPVLIENEELAEEAAKAIGESSLVEISGEDVETAMSQLDLTPANNPRHIYRFMCGGNASVICFPEDWEYAQE